MKKLMFAAALAACGGAFADNCNPVTPTTEAVARVYQMELKTYTTKGVVLSYSTTTAGSTCVPGTTTSECLVKRGKDKTVIRGYLYICSDKCAIEEYLYGFVDSKRVAPFGTFEDDGSFTSTATFTPKFVNFIGANNTDVEIAWDFVGAVEYDSARSQTYTLVGAGYGKLGNGATIFADKMSGYFAGTATAPYDLVTKATAANQDCVCEASKVLKCDDYAALTFDDEDTVAFGSWKLRFNANVSKAYLSGNWGPVDAIKKLLK